MKFLVAPQAFKGTLSPFAAAHAIELGIKHVFPNAEICLLPVADGGDGTLEVLVNAKLGTMHPAVVKDAHGREVGMYWGALPDNATAIIELASVCGLAMQPFDKCNIATASTFGVGEVIKTALEAGFRRFVIGIGGSATNDAGTGLAAALGVRFMDKRGKDLPFGGLALADLDRIDMAELDPRIQDCHFSVACDVSNPLLGPKGATAVYAPQKGASPEVVSKLESALSRFNKIAQRDLGLDLGSLPMGGAAGGTGAGMAAFLGAELRPGIDLILEQLNFEHHLRDVDLVITGEGRLDQQTLYNKAPFGVARAAKKYRLPVLAIVGTISSNYRAVHQGFDAVIPISHLPVAPLPSTANAQDLLTQVTEEAIRCFQMGTKRHLE